MVDMAATNQPILIVLNGASSSGKTSTANALLDLLDPPCVVTGLDDMFERFRPFGPELTGTFSHIRRRVLISWFQFTNGRLRLFRYLHRDVVCRIQTGQSVIVDTAMMDPRALRDAASCFAPLHGILVGMKPPLAVSEEWEAKRGDRPPGHARKHYDLIHAHGIYDLMLDPSQLTPQECARTIVEWSNSQSATAFQHLCT